MYRLHAYRKFSWSDIQLLVPFEIDILIACIEIVDKEQEEK